MDKQQGIIKRLKDALEKITTNAAAKDEERRMTDSTKLLFGAPWRASYWCVFDNQGRSVATTVSRTDAHCEDPSLDRHVREWRKLLQSIKDAE